MNSAPANHQLGEYQLLEILGENSISRCWLAEQTSISRRVIVNELLPGQPRESFMADARAKAAVDHPLIGSIYEAVDEPDLCFYAHERLPGVSLLDRQTSGERMSPAILAHVIRRVAEAAIYHETLGHATSPLDLAAIHLDPHGIIRLENLAIAGPRSTSQSERDVIHLGHSLTALVADRKPGTTRLLTLFSWMRGDGLDSPISWGQVHEFCQQIEHQLSDPVSSPTQRIARSRRKKFASPGLIIGSAIGLILGVIVLVEFLPEEKTIPPRASLPEPVSIGGGTYKTPDGQETTLTSFRISANEVTIGQYADFLETLDMLAKSQDEKAFDHAEQPAEKADHKPDHWDPIFAAGKSNSTWGGRPVTLDSPVTGIDWWDAAAYAEWKKARLPTQEEWFAALMATGQDPATLETGGWLPVTSQAGDRTANGLIGMSGSVCEWADRPAPNPANPLGEKLWVILGGSYLKAGSGALSREWTSDRSLRRPDLGFRLVYD
jgi:hypothetical protein